MASLLTASLISTIAGVGSLVFGFASSVVTARLLGAHGAGLVAFAIWFGTATATIAGLGIQDILLRYMGIAGDGEASRRGLARTLLRPFTVATLVATVGMLLWAGYQWSLGDVEMTAVWLATAVFNLAFAYGSMSLSAARGSKDFAASARQVLYGCLLQLPFVVVGAYFFGAAGAMLGQIVRHLPQALALRKYVVRTPEPKQDALTPPMRAYGRNVWLSNIVGLFIWTRIEFLFLGIAHAPAEIGYFAVGMTLAGLVVQLPEQMSAALLPYFGHHHDRNDTAQLERSYRRVFRWVALFVMPVCFGGAAIMPELLPLIFGQAFAPAVPAAVILMASSGITALTIFPDAMITARERSGFMLKASIVTALATVILLSLVVPSGGATGAAIVRAIVHIAWLVVPAFYCWRYLSMPPPVLDIARIALSAAACAGAAFMVLSFQAGPTGIVLGVLAGAVVYLVCLRLSRAVPEEDLETLSVNLGPLLPEPLRNAAIGGLRIITPVSR